MSLPYPIIDQDHERFGSLVQKGPKGTEMLLYWIKVAQIQGKTYEKLFSPAAFLRPPNERAQIATELVQALDHAWTERGEASALDFAFATTAPPNSSQKKLGRGPNKAETPSKRNRAVLTYPTSAQLSLGALPVPRRYIEGAVLYLANQSTDAKAYILRFFWRCKFAAPLHRLGNGFANA